ncbi:MAG: hypothetical protein JWO05_1693 [Gemmatimonadetes bacterium]|nr:hypothetical protein [Gemmatimonadota bacterium]
MKLIRTCLFLAIAATACACDSPKTLLELDDIQRAARDTASLAAESALLVEQIRQGRLGDNYVWVHQQALQEESRKAAQSLQKPARPDLRERQQLAVVLDARLALGLQQVAQGMADPAELQRLAKSFNDIETQANALKGGKK